MPLIPVAATLVALSMPDPYAVIKKPSWQVLIQSAELGDPGADARLAAWLKSNPHAPILERRMGEHQLCTDYQARNDHSAATSVCAAATALGANDSQSAAISLKLRDMPSLRTIGSARVPLARNGLGSRDANVEVNGVTVPWLMDTGAQISVVSLSLARKIGVRMLDRETKVKVGSTTSDVQGGIGMIDLLRIGAASVENVPVLVLPDAQLKIGDLPQIQAIFGLPIFVAFRRVAWLDGGSSLILGDEAPRIEGNAQSLYWQGEGIGLPVSTPRGTLGAHLDTGANDTTLRVAAHTLLDAKTEKSAERYSATVGGAGGLRKIEMTRYPNVPLTIAGSLITFNNIKLDNNNTQSVARVGDDFVSRTKRLILDFETMKVEAAPQLVK